MNIHAPVSPKTDDVAVGPRLGSRKVYASGELFPDIRVPFRELDAADETPEFSPGLAPA